MCDEAGPSRANKRRCSARESTKCSKKKFWTEDDIEKYWEAKQMGYDSSSDEYVPDSESDDSSSESTETENETTPSTSTQPSENGVQFPADRDHPSPNFEWADSGPLKEIQFKKQQKLLVPIPEEGKPIDFFQLIFDDNFLRSIVEQTNAYAIEVLFSPGTMEKSRITTWKELTVEELKIFLALMLHTGTISLTRLNDYWKTDPLFNLPLFRQYMSRNRFLLILRCLHFTTAETDPSDRLGKIRSVVDFFNEKMEALYYPGRELSLDEAMVLWRGRLQFKQYIKNKRHKYGIKLYMLTEPDGLILKFRVYEGGSDIYGGTGHTEKIVLHLLHEKLNNGHAVYLDNYYNSVELATKLLEKDTYCTGTLRVDRKNNPAEVMKAKLKKGENKSMFSNYVHVGKWRDKRDVHYISTEFGNQMGIFKNRRGVETEKPAAIIGYNANMSGIDRQDQMMSYYPCSRKTIRWYKKLFLHVLQMGLINSFYLHKKYSTQNPKGLYEFRLDIIRSWLTSHNPAPEIPPTAPLETNHCPTKIQKTSKEVKGERESKRISRKECRVCRRKDLRKQTTFECKACPGNPGLCVECFDEYHKK